MITIGRSAGNTAEYEVLHQPLVNVVAVERVHGIVTKNIFSFTHKRSKNMTQEMDLDRLEEFVGRLLEQYNQLKDAHASLKNQLAEREATISQLNGEIEGLNGEVAGLTDKLETSDIKQLEAGDRVSSIISKIEEWETGLAGMTDEAVSDDASRQGNLFGGETGAGGAE